MKTKLAIASLTLLLLACDGGKSLDRQVEKCVEAGVRAGEPFESEKARSLAEARWRLRCLNAASGRTD
jgi:hypothetical protein